MRNFAYLGALDRVRKDIVNQVSLQVRKWGMQGHTQDEWMAILKEELAEFVCNVVVAKKDGYDEMIHVAAVATAWLVDIKLSKEEQK